MSLDTKNPTIYGIRSLKQMINSKRPKNSIKQVQTIEKTMKYFNEKLDHIIGRCITYMLCVQPDDVIKAMLDYFIKYKANEELDPYKNINRNKARKDQKLLLATTIGPLVTTLIHQIARIQPDDPIDYIINTLESIINDNKVKVHANDDMIDSTLASDTSNKSLINDLEVINNSNSTNKSIQIAVLGLGSSGKTSIINSIQGIFDLNIKPTIGFRPINLTMKDNTLVKFYDLGGGKKIRDIWSQYYHDVHGFIYVIDSSTINQSIDELNEVKLYLQNAMNHSFLANKPCLILANKQDIENSINHIKLKELLDINEDSSMIYISDCIGIGLTNSPEHESILDDRIDKSLEWLLNTILSNYEIINNRLLLDIKIKKNEEVKKRNEKEKKVLKNKIIYAFPHLINPTIPIDIEIPNEPIEVFTEEEGLSFLSSEIGLDNYNELPDIAKEICQLVGYQRLALQIIGSFKSPVSKKKTPMSWDDILTLIMELRNELGL